jgi:hypothetical protein
VVKSSLPAASTTSPRVAYSYHQQLPLLRHLRKPQQSLIVAGFESPYSSAVPALGFGPIYQYQSQQQPSPLYSASIVSDLTLMGDQRYTPYETPPDDNPPRPAKRPKTSESTLRSSIGESTNYDTQMKTPDAAGPSAAAEGLSAATNKPKRVRTGCLTCRERHLKCDEGLPNCQNCRKSSRVCKRGVRLNFIDTQVQSPPMIPPTADWAGRKPTHSSNWLC